MLNRFSSILIVSLSVASVGLFVSRRTKDKDTNASSSTSQVATASDQKDKEPPHTLTPSSVPTVTNASATTPESKASTAPSVSELAESFRALSNEDLNEKLEDIKQRLDAEEWIERANHGSLNADARNQLEEILNTESAAKIVLLERDMARLKGKYL